MIKMPRTLLHVCCAPCACFPVSLLAVNTAITMFWCNPNIAPVSENDKRKDEVLYLGKSLKIPVVESENIYDEWLSAVSPFSSDGERSERCRQCIRIRMRKSFEYAVRHNFSSVGTSLSVSPHKDYVMIQSIGKECESLYDIPFLDIDFKKNNGTKIGRDISKSYGFYRQNYCGCEYSRLERLEFESAKKTDKYKNCKVDLKKIG